MQAQHPIAYYSKLLGPRAQAKSVYEKELMVVCLAIQKWRHYLMGRHLIVRTDQQSLRYIMQQREVGSQYQKWVSKLIGLDFEIQYKPRASNRVADALSRKNQGNMELGAAVCTQGVDWSELQQEIERDPTLQQLRNDLQKDANSHTYYSLVEGRLMYKGRIVIPKSASFIPLLLEQYHDSQWEGTQATSRPTLEWQPIGTR